MKNPCDTCLIQPMCSKMCPAKAEYRLYWNKQLESICKNHLYTKGGNKRSEKFIKPEILNLKKKITERLDRNSFELLKILFRAQGTFE